MSDAQLREARILDILQERYEGKGFDFFKEPSGDLVPSFLQGYRPDAIALGDGKKIILEIKTRAYNSTKALSQIAKLFSNQDSWTFKVFFAEDFSDTTNHIPKPEKNDILKELNVAKKLKSEGYLRQAFITAWVAFEAASHTRNTDHNASWKSPNSLLEFLEHQGIIEYDTGRKLKQLLKIRNSILHGDLKETIKKNDIDFLTKVTKKILL